MDNRITKKRLSDYLAYEWILIIFLCVVAIIVWELVYTVSAVGLSVGQDYKFFYDKTLVYGQNYNDLMTELNVQDNMGYENGKTFSYEIQKLHAENILDDNDVMSLRLSVQEGDMLFTDDKEREIEGESYTTSLAKTRVDSYDIPIATYEDLLKQAKEYLTGLLIDGQTEIKAENLDDDKIKAGFEDRLSGDNRFRSATEKEKGLALEKERLVKLCQDVADFEKIMSLGDEYFFTYTKFEQSKTIAESEEEPNQENIAEIKEAIPREKDKGRENARYGLKVGKLKNQTNNQKTDVSKFFSIVGEETDVSANVVIMVFDFIEYQPELQFESISVINNIVRACSTILD